MQFAADGPRMRGLVISSLGDDLSSLLQVRDDIVVPAPSAGEIRVKVAAASINPVDWKRSLPEFGATCTFPAAPGVDGAGIVDAVGDGVTLHAAGDRVHFHAKFPAPHGSLAEYAICNATSAVKLDDDIAFDVGAALPCAAWTAYEALFDKLDIANPRHAGKLIYIPGGAGGVGQFAVMFAVASGLRVISSAGNDENVRLLQGLGCAHVFNYRAVDSVVDEVRKAAGGQGVNFAVETVSAENCAKTAETLCFGGSLVSIVCPITVVPSMFMRAISCHHVLLGLHAFQASQEDVECFQRFGAGTLDMFRKGALSVDISVRASIEEAKEQLLESMRGHTRGKRVIMF